MKFSHAFLLGMLLLVLSLLPALPAGAQTVQVPELYRAEVAVPDSSVASRNDSFKAGIAQVLIKLSGSRSITEAPATEAIVARASQYALGYSYIRSETPEQPLLIRIEFDGPALERALLAAGLPVWGANRPAVLVWLAVDQGRERYIVAEDSETELKSHLQRSAAMRGVPLMLPLMDLEDRSRVEFGDIRAGFTENLIKSASRYNVEIMLIGFLRQQDARHWSVKWTVQRDNTASSWQEKDVELATALNAGVDNLADILASRYAFASTPDAQSRDYRVAIDQLMTLEQYAAVQNLLQSMIFVEYVTPVLLETGRAEFNVRMRGSLAQLEKTLLLSNRLRPVVAEPATEAAETTTQPAVDLRFVLHR